MLRRPAKRHYSKAALDHWLDRLAGGWEHLFAPEAVEAGRALYRAGDVREVELTSTEATLLVTWENAPSRVVLSVAHEKLSWRASSESALIAETLAVAGIYEVEELLGDEATGLPDIAEGEMRQRGKAPGTPVEILMPEAGVAGGFNAKEKSPREKGARELILVFSEDDGELLCRPIWKMPRNAGGQRVPAYGKNSPSAEKLSENERAVLLRLATNARKTGFAFDASETAWRLSGSSSVIDFVNRDFPLWLKRWRIEGREEVWPLGRELPELELEAVAEEDASGDGFGYRWRVGLDGDWLPEETLQKIFERETDAVFVRGRGFARLGKKQRAALKESEDAPTATLPRYVLLSLFNDDRVKISVDAGLAAWRDALLREPAVPENLPTFLRPYQTRGVAWLAQMLAHGTHPLLADEMGLGKTVQILSLLLAKPLSERILIVCPASVVPVWEAEIARFFPGTPVGILGRGKDFVRDESPKIWLASYTQLRRNAALLAQVEFSHAVLDEAQYIKNPATKVTETCLAIRARHRLALTGTPVENHPLDIWTIFRFLMPGLLGRRADFEKRLNDDPAAIARLTRQVAPFVLRRTKNIVATDLPPKISVPLLCPMSETQRDVYRRLVEEGVAEFGNETPDTIASRGGLNFFTLLTRLRQAACDPGLLPGNSDVPVTHSGKIELLLERLAEILENKRKVVIFSQFVSLLTRVEAELKKRFPTVPLFKLTGSTTNRAVPVTSFQETDGAGIMLVSLRAGGTGITLHSAEYVFLLDPWWNPAVEAQAVDRVHRLGQKNTTFVYRMISADTVEARIEALKAAKSELFANVVGDLPDMSDWEKHFPSLRALIG